jgi:single-strand selective monofunctional uracil DNA glycosylase
LTDLARHVPASRRTKSLVDISRALARQMEGLRFAAPVTHVYNPLRYAAALHEAYLCKYGGGDKRVLLLGMNPGPFGMAQTGVPFGDVTMVRDWLGLSAAVARPAREHPKRPVLGLDCPRGEVSGARLWGWAQAKFGTPERFFSRFFVVNYCPLAFLEESGRNRTPDKLPAAEQTALFAACDEALREVVAVLRAQHVVGVGAFATGRARRALDGTSFSGSIHTILHPSPASPAANRGWAETAERQLVACGALEI